MYLGERQHDDPDVVLESHHRMLESVFERYIIKIHDDDDDDDVSLFSS